MDTKVEQFLQEQFHQFSQIDVRELVFRANCTSIGKKCLRKIQYQLDVPARNRRLETANNQIPSLRRAIYLIWSLLCRMFSIMRRWNRGENHGSQTENPAKTAESVPHAIFGAGGCSLCPSCTYPLSTCRKPGEATPSLEAVGIDVYQLASKAGLKYYHGPSTVTYFAMVLL